MKKSWFVVILFALLLAACGDNGDNPLSGLGGQAGEPTPTVLAQDADDDGVPPIGEVAEEPMEAPVPTPTLAPTTPATEVPTEEATKEPSEEATEEPTEESDTGAPTPTPWPSIQMPKGQIVLVPAGYTVVGDVSICLKADGDCSKTYLDDDPLTTSVWTFDEPAYVRYDFGSGWAEHVSDPQVFVDGQLSDGCGDGCTTVGNYRWPADAALIGATVSAAATPAAPRATEESEAETPEGVATVTDEEWFLPSWAEVAPEAALPQLQAMGVVAEDVQSWMMPEALPLVPPDVLVYQVPSTGDCYAENVPTDSCTTGRLRPFSSKETPIESGELLRMTGDAIGIRWTDTGELLALRPDGDEKHDNWIVLNLSSGSVEVDINAPYGSDRSWYTATNAWTPELVDLLTRQMIQDFNLQYREEQDFAATPVPNCENSEGCTYSNIRVVIVFDDQVLAFTGKWFENQDPHWEAFAPTLYER